MTVTLAPVPLVLRALHHLRRRNHRLDRRSSDWQRARQHHWLARCLPGHRGARIGGAGMTIRGAAVDALTRADTSCHDDACVVAPADSAWDAGRALVFRRTLCLLHLSATFSRSRNRCGCFAFSIVPIGWSTWITRTVPEDAESGGGLFVATTQLAITLGAAVGGIAIDSSGAVGAIVVSAVLLLLSMPATILALRGHAALSVHQTVSSQSA